MEGWPVQASDEELAAAAELARALVARGFEPLMHEDLVNGDGVAMLSPWDAHVALLRAGAPEVLYEPTEEVAVADVTQVGGGVWVRSWVRVLCITAACCDPRLKAPEASGGPREHLEAVYRRNVPWFAGYIADAMAALVTDEDRAAMMAAHAVAGRSGGPVVHMVLFPHARASRALEAPPMMLVPAW